MNTRKGYRILSTLICLTLMLALSIGNVNASSARQGETDFAAIDAYITEQMNHLGIPGTALGIVQDDQMSICRVLALQILRGEPLRHRPPFTSARSRSHLLRWR